MTLVKWTPIRLNRSLKYPYSWRDKFLSDSSTPVKSNTIYPAIATGSTGKNYLLTAELPGVDKNDIEISIKDRTLTVSGERIEKSSQFECRFNELEFGKFNRTFYLPDDIIENEIKAEYQNGVLTVEIPKAEPVKPETKNISIQ